jgi:hypothetical protein
LPKYDETLELLTKPFSLENFGTYTSALWGEDFSPLTVRNVILGDKDFPGVKSVKMLSTYEDTGLNVVVVIAVELKKTTYIENQRAYQRGVVSYILEKSREWEKAIVAYYAEGETAWRLSYVEVNKENQTNVVIPIYRWTFLVGENVPCRTIMDSSKKFFTDYAGKPVLVVEHIEPIFKSLNAVTDVFYKEFMSSYDAIKEDMLWLSNGWGTAVVERTVKLIMGQTMSLFFLQKRGFLGLKEGQTWGDGDPSYLTKKLLNYDGGNIYKDILAPIMLALSGDSNLKGEFFPILGGGLFTLADNFEDGTHFELPTESFKDFVSMLSSFNFTVSESDQYDKDVAVDPEMLGKIYQHILLLESGDYENSKEKGTFYTPSDIVSFMAKDSISNWLTKKLEGKLSIDAIDELIDTPELDLDLLRTLDLVLDTEGRLIRDGIMRSKFESKGYISHLKEIDTLLRGMLVLEPAVGSGGFLVGSLQEVVKIRRNIGVILLFLHELNNQEFELYSNFNLKKHSVSNNFYGVDVIAGAVDIAKLRTWLSLIVDMEDPMLLPNLDFKLVVGNSLIDRVWINELVPDVSVLDLTLLEELKAKYIMEEHSSKVALRNKITQEMLRILSGIGENGSLTSFSLEEQDGSFKNLSRFTTQLELDELFKNVFSFNFSFSEIMKNGGFDLVIGNPPYVRATRLGLIKEELAQKFKRTFHGSADLLVYFYEQGYNLLKDDGILAYITSNAWLRSKYGEKLRKFLTEETELLVVIDFQGNRVFKGVGVDTEITILRKSKPSSTSDLLFCHAKGYSLEE